MKTVSTPVTEPDHPEITDEPGHAADGISPLANLDALIAEIEAAPVGSTALDARIHYGFNVSKRHSADVAAVMVEHGVSWPTVEEVLNDQVPPFTTSLDAALAGEDIVFVIRSAKREQWGAMQKSQGGEEVLVWAATEPLARRLAAIRAWRNDLENMPDQAQQAVVSTAQTAEPANAAADKDWEVLF